MKKVKIGNRIIGKDEPTFIIAEAGVNHNGDIKLAKKLIGAASDAGADAVKFQTWVTEEIITKDVPKPEYQLRTTGSEESQYDMLKKLELSWDDHVILKDYADECGILFSSTPGEEKSTDLLESLGVKFFKIGSDDLTNHPLLEYVARKGKPMIVSTGMGNLGEIEEAMDTICSTGNGNVILLHCTFEYPPAFKDLNLRTIKTMQRAFQIPVGYSDHTTDFVASLAAVSLGSSVIEKHITTDKTLPGPDHAASLEPDEFNKLVKSIRNCEEALGSYIKKPSASELENMKIARKSIVANVEIPEGSVIEKHMAGIKRPGTGLPPKDISIVVGRKAKTRIKRDELIALENLI